MNLKELNDEELVSMYPSLISELKEREIIRTDNVVGEIGEYLAINQYNKTPGLPKLIRTAKSTKNIDVVSNKGERYSIKTITTSTTGVIHGVDTIENKLFEKLIIVQLDKKFVLKRVIEIDWATFFKHKKWHSTMKAHNIQVTKSLLDDAVVIYSDEN